ncbi:N-acyl homoserine lactonase family protein [Azospirillum sp. A1-3]|uniref:N-acyl homoserine lactonase family protein n=1 Tax=Azospirillum sp. A1-3 TaxID=185874 RepID=UPI0020777639|nr:N-acyl homoserine lactonase family protein [Azospirillum sp. A1-3]MCM8737680.1 N-acyl homoserine lactonase family protein [Azospirillum sp. A1-3]
MKKHGESTEYEIYAIRYGTNTNRTRGRNFILDAQPNEILQMDFFCWFLRNGDHAIIIDTGMDAGKAARHGHTMLLDPVSTLRDFGIEPDAIETVVITHMHYDHTGHLGSFPHARFHMQAEEMAYVTGPWMGQRWFRHAYEVDEICQMVELLHQGRVDLHGRDREIADGVSVHWVGGHCAGQEIVRVRTARGWVVLASDALHYYEELERGIPFAVAFNVSDMIAAHGRIREMADSDDHVIPAHDPRVIDLYPPAGPGFEGRVHRVDLPPRLP